MELEGPVTLLISAWGWRGSGNLAGLNFIPGKITGWQINKQKEEEYTSARQYRNEETVKVLKWGISQSSFYFWKRINKATKSLTNVHQMLSASLASDHLFVFRQMGTPVYLSILTWTWGLSLISTNLWTLVCSGMAGLNSFGYFCYAVVMATSTL